jgi:hypothetical protein
MKTTIELSDALINELKHQAKEKKSTMREIMEEALRLYFDRNSRDKKPYIFKNRSFKGNGVCDGVAEGEWDSIRGRIYEGRGN